MKLKPEAENISLTFISVSLIHWKLVFIGFVIYYEQSLFRHLVQREEKRASFRSLLHKSRFRVAIFLCLSSPRAWLTKRRKRDCFLSSFVEE